MHHTENSEQEHHFSEDFPHLGWAEVFAVPAELKGATILRIGSFPEKAELIIQYRAVRGEEKQLVLGFTELGMWIESVGRLTSPNQDALR